MSHFHAVVWIDYKKAQILQFNADSVELQKVHAHQHNPRQHNSTLRAEHEFFGEVCDDLADVGEIVVTGSHSATADFRHYVIKHRSAIAPRMVGWEIVDHPTDGQLVAWAKKYFVKHDQMVGTRAISAVTAPESKSAPHRRQALKKP